nr:unnamed protein product [Callosobruchus analis]
MHPQQLPHLHQMHLQSLKNFSRVVTLIHRRTLSLQKLHLPREVGWLGSQQRRRESSHQGSFSPQRDHQLLPLFYHSRTKRCE